ncbi:MAG: TraB/GumN family protein [Sphingomicrobium sp.]
MLAALGLAALMWMLPQPAVAAPAMVEADPAIFVIRDHDTTVYLFGTFHVLSPDLHWFDGPIEQAFADSDQLIVETLPVESAAPAGTLPRTAARITPAATFLASTQDAVRAGQSQGMALANGADIVLLRAATEIGKSVEPLETLESQFAMIAAIPAEAATSSYCAGNQCLAPAADLSTAMTQLQGAWASGEHGLFAAMLGDMQLTAPNAYRILFVERNTRWSDWVAARMRQPGTVFVAIGAAHLAGADSLLVRLAQRGLISRRVH